MTGTNLWSRVMAKWVVLVWMWIYVAALLVSTHTLIAPYFGYYGFVPRDWTLTEALLVVEGTCVVALTPPARCRRPSEVAQLFLAVTVAVPVLWIPLLYGPLDGSQVGKLSLSTTGAFALIWLALRGTRHPFSVLELSRRTYLVALMAVFVLALGYLVATGVTLNIVGFDDVYGQRALYAEGIGTFGAYLVGWLSGGLFPVMLAVGLYRRNPALVVAQHRRRPVPVCPQRPEDLRDRRADRGGDLRHDPARHNQVLALAGPADAGHCPRCAA